MGIPNVSSQKLRRSEWDEERIQLNDFGKLATCGAAEVSLLLWWLLPLLSGQPHLNGPAAVFLHILQF